METQNSKAAGKAEEEVASLKPTLRSANRNSSSSKALALRTSASITGLEEESVLVLLKRM